MPSKRQVKSAEHNWRRERLERLSTDELLNGMNGIPRADGRPLFVGAGGRTIVREILRTRGVITD